MISSTPMRRASACALPALSGASMRSISPRASWWSAGLPLTGRAASAPSRKAWAGAATASRVATTTREVRRMTEVLGRRPEPLSGRTLGGLMPDAPLSRRALFGLGLGRLSSAFGTDLPKAPRPPEAAALDPERLAFEQADLHALTAEPAAALASVAPPLPGED